MERIQLQDRAAFAVLVERHLDAIHGYLERLSGSPCDADDLAQDVFLRVWQKAGTYQTGRVQVATWLYRIAHNLAIDSFRRQRPTSFTDLDLDVETVNGESELTRSITQVELEEGIGRALNALPIHQRTALSLCRVHGFSNAQAAVIMDISVRAVESLLARARRGLKTLIRNGIMTDPSLPGEDLDQALDNALERLAEHQAPSGLAQHIVERVLAETRLLLKHRVFLAGLVRVSLAIDGNSRHAIGAWFRHRIRVPGHR